MEERRKQSLINHYQTELARMLSDQDFARYGMRNKIVKYSTLKDYPTINDLLPEPFDFRIVLIESKPNSGHWTCILKYKNIIEWFNSYGTATGYDFNFIPTQMRQMLGQGRDDLLELLRRKNPDQQLYYNKKRLQSNNDGINTCGRWVIARCLAGMCGFELDDFIKKCEDKKKETGKPYDILAVDWIPAGDGREI
jgi:hypothetical protein